MWNKIVTVLNKIPGIDIDTVEIEAAVAQPAFPEGARISDVRAAEARVAGAQQNYEGAIAGGTEAQAEYWRVQLEIAQATLAELRRIRTAGPNSLTDQ